MRIKISFLLFIVLLITACNRYDLFTHDNKILINEVKTSFLDKKANNNTNNQSLNFRQALPRTVLWDQAREGKDSSILVPIHLTLIKDSIVRTADGAPLNGNIWLYAKKKDNNWTFTMWTLIPTNNDKTKFTGTLLSEDYFQGIVFYSNYINGKIVQNKEIIKKQNIAKRKKLAATVAYKMAGGWSYDCNERMYTICVGNPENPKDDYMCSQRYEITCKWNWTNPGLGDNQERIDWIDCSDGGCGGGGGGGAPAENYDCANVLNGSAYIGDCGKCVGGTTGINNCADIKNLITNACLKKMVNDILSKNLELEARVTLQSVFGINTKFNLFFTESTSLPNSTGGVAIGQRVSINGNVEKLDVEIQLNVNTLQNASQEYIAMIIIHEAVHAHLYKKGIIGDPWPFGDHANAHHEIMWVNYVDFISNYLVENFGRSLKDANSLAMEGLHRTMGSKLNDKIYLAINSKAKEPISDERARINTKYKLGQLGSKCNN